MIFRYIVVIKMLLVVFILCFANKSHAQVDPEWLNSWNQAVDLRPESLSSNTVIVSKDEPGIPLVVHGQIFQPNGQEVANNVIIHMYHRDNQGFDFGLNDKLLTTWRLQGWAKTNSSGKFEFYTIRPAPDHIGREGGHIHFTVVSAEFGKQWAHKIHFLDDPKITDNEKQQSAANGQFGWVKEVTTLDGIQHINVAIKLKEKTDF
jgi:protocatechuate 3,4-dioxygenase beta subunit